MVIGRVRVIQLRGDRVSNAVERRKHPQEGERARVDHFLTIDEYGELTIMTVDELDVDAQLLS